MREKIETLDTNKNIFWALSMLLFTLLLLYGYFLNGTIQNIVRRQKAVSHAAGISAEISSLESKTFALKDNLTLEKATILGLLPVTNPIFITRSTLSKSLSINIIR